jgi:hypothetical protein
MAYRGGDVHGLYVVAVSERDPADPAARVLATTSASSAIVSTVAAGTATSTHGRGSSDASPTPSGWLDHNTAPQLSPSLASSSMLPNGHDLPHDHRDVGGGILGFPPPLPVTGMPLLNPLPQSLVRSDVDGFQLPRSPPIPKIEFPKFSGDNPRL